MYTQLLHYMHSVSVYRSYHGQVAQVVHDGERLMELLFFLTNACISDNVGCVYGRRFSITHTFDTNANGPCRQILIPFKQYTSYTLRHNSSAKILIIIITMHRNNCVCIHGINGCMGITHNNTIINYSYAYPNTLVQY